MTADGPKVRQLLHDVNFVLSAYIAVHDAVFKFSWRKAIPLPFIFKPVDFAGQVRALEMLRAGLSQIIDELHQMNEGSVAQILLEYSNALLEAIGGLERICYQLQQKADGRSEYRYSEYQKAVEDYERNVEDYRRLGELLNRRLSSLG